MVWRVIHLLSSEARNTTNGAILGIVDQNIAPPDNGNLQDAARASGSTLQHTCGEPCKTTYRLGTTPPVSGCSDPMKVIHQTPEL